MIWFILILLLIDTAYIIWMCIKTYSEVKKHETLAKSQDMEVAIAPKVSQSYLIRDSTTGHVLARRHSDDPELKAAMLDPTKVVEID